MPLSRAALEDLILTEDPRALADLFARADRIRREEMGEGILLRGLVEFSNRCDNTCHYCGLRGGNASLERYRLTRDEIMKAASEIVSYGIRTIVLQSGEDAAQDAAWIADIVREIKERSRLAVTLSVGERPRSDYALWKKAGADRYLLKIETSDPALYASLHDGRSIATRLACLADLRELGYQVGSGSMVGLPGQTAASIAGDILFFAERDFDMIGIGPFIPHAETPLARARVGEAALVLKATALTRIVTRNAHMPATTALGSIGAAGEDRRLDGLRCGANVLMPNFTPALYRSLYEIYPGKRCLDEKSGACVGCLEKKAASIGRTIDRSRGDSRKRREVRSA